MTAYSDTVLAIWIYLLFPGNWTDNVFSWHALLKLLQEAHNEMCSYLLISEKQTKILTCLYQSIWLFLCSLIEPMSHSILWPVSFLNLLQCSMQNRDIFNHTTSNWLLVSVWISAVKAQIQFISSQAMWNFSWHLHTICICWFCCYSEKM